ncbi:hypothetical protein P0082_04775 [Candidatus Haliotispira prima]|uniref:Hexokinase n=1 Tax=Candidatus Haliotispira prima TaxID=3034016 RepID=A0ABY8MJM9_9SPIO|nr:hypothetical protein P0082_04775 [Candidatus Haliotispira prima]
MPASDTLETGTNRTVVRQFLERHGLVFGSGSAVSGAEPEQLLSDYLAEMEKGLKAPGTGSLKMIPAYISPDKPFLRNQATPVLDAGGTNLRCALITIPGSGPPLSEHYAKREMPALKAPLSSADFFAEIADFVAPVLLEYYRRYQQAPPYLGFCFSYPTQIVITDKGDLDGKLLQWSKEVKVPELVGRHVGRSLLKVLGQKFGREQAPRHICIINDTVATLLAGRAAADDADYTDFVGYILGTGINSCHAEPKEVIAALDERYRAERAIVNVESGNYSRFPQSSFDKEYNALTQDPGAYLQEKASSGRYWGELVCIVLRGAAREGILPADLENLPLQSSAAMNALLQHPGKPGHLGSIKLAAGIPPGFNGTFAAWLDEQGPKVADVNVRERIYFLIEAVLERSALFTAINMAACILRSEGGTSPLNPVCLTVDGSTFYALHRFSLRVRFWLDEILSEERGRKRYYRIKTVENAPLLGAAIAALGFGQG